MPLLLRSLFLFGLGMLALPAALEAQSPTERALARRVDSLVVRILELESRIAQLERPATAQPAAQSTLRGNSRDVANWRRLREGMSYDAVREILGEPDRIAGGTVAYWTYPRSGEVGFVSGRLVSWKEPGR